MLVSSAAIVVLASVAVAYGASSRLHGEASLIGGYFAGLAAGALTALLVTPLSGLTDETLQGTLVLLKELVCLAPFAGVLLAQLVKALPRVKVPAPRLGLSRLAPHRHADS